MGFIILPEEINANAFVKPIENNGKKTDFVRKNINNYLRKYTNHKKSFNYDFYENKEVIKFYTKGFMLEEKDVFELYSEGYKKA